MIHLRDKGKVDHSEGTTKDVADSVCRVFNNLYNSERIKNVNRYDAIGSLVQMHKKTKKFQKFVDSKETMDVILKEEEKRIGVSLGKVAGK